MIENSSSSSRRSSLPLDFRSPQYAQFKNELTKHDRVDALEVGGVGDETKVDFPSVGVGAIHARAKMVLNTFGKHKRL